MSKKMLKRSLALGALMAFVITGQAWAANGSILNSAIDSYKGTEIDANATLTDGDDSGRTYGVAVTSGNPILDTGALLKITNKQEVMNRNYGIVIESGTSLTVKNAVSVDVANYSDFRTVGIRNNYGGNLLFEKDVTVVATSTGNGDGMTSIGVDAWGDNTIFNGNVVVDVDATGDVSNSNIHTRGVQVGNGANIEFNGNKTVVTAVNDGGTIAGVGFAAGYGGGTVYFNSETTEITVNSANGLAYGLNCLYTDDGNYYFGYDESGNKVKVDSATIKVKSGEGGCAVGVSGTLYVSDDVKLFKVIAEGPAHFQNGGNDATTGISLGYANKTSTIKSEQLVVDVIGATTNANNSYLSGVDVGNSATLNIDSKDIYISVIDNSGNNKAYAVHTGAVRDENDIVKTPGNGKIRVGKAFSDDGVSKVVVIGDVMSADSSDVTINLGTPDSSFTGAAYTDNTSTTTINLANGAIWDVTGASTVTNATFAEGSVLNLVDGNKFTDIDYALTGTGTLNVTNGDKLQIGNIKETTYNIAQGFGTDLANGKNWKLDNNLMEIDVKAEDSDQGWYLDETEKTLQLAVKAKDAGQIAEDMGVDSGTASALGSIIEAANSGSVPDTEAAQNVVKFAQEIASASPEVAASAAEAVIKMAEAGGNSATAANIVKNVTGVTNDRLSFNCGHSAPHKGGHGVGLFEEGSGADIWAEYVHGKDKVEDMPSSAGASSYEGQYNGFVLGVDFKKVNKFQSGIAFNYGEGDTNTVGSAVRTRSDYDFWGVGYYGNIHNDDSNVIFDINYAQTDSEVTQKNLTGDIEASPETTTWSAGVKLEKLYQNENVQIVPYTGLRYMSIDPDDYATKCGTYKYSMDRQDIWLLPVGVSIRQEIANDNGWTVSPRVDLSYIWAFGDTDSNMEFATALNTKTNIGYDVMDDGSFLGLVGIEAHKGQWGYGVSYSYQKGDHSESKKWYVDVNYSF